MVWQATFSVELKHLDALDHSQQLAALMQQRRLPVGTAGCLATGSLRRVAIVSSRLRKRLDEETQWVARLRHLLAELPPESTQVLIHQQGAGADLVVAGCRLFGLDTLILHRERRSGLRRLDLPAADEAVFALADEIRVLRCRPHGNIARLLQRHLSDPVRERVPVYLTAECLPALSGEQRRQVRLMPDDSSESVVDRGDCRHAGGQDPVRLRHLPDDNPLVCPDRWLCHWTRPASGPWPGESWQQYCESLLQECCDHSACGTLQRIMSERLLRASHLAIRGGHRVVAFTAVPLGEFRSRRVFRGHRQRFDFEPWGVAVRRAALSAWDLRPVRYGSEESWRALPVADQPWYQKGTRDGVTDTIAEAEWRVPGDVDLSRLSESDVVVFVDTQAAAARIQASSLWPVLVLPDEFRQNDPALER